MKVLLVGKEARQKSVQALSKIASAVATTLGPRGLPSIIDSESNLSGKVVPSITKDGLTFLNAMRFECPIENAIHGLCTQASSHTVVSAGDGSTSTIVLASAIAEQIMKSIDTSNRPQKMVRDLQKQANLAIECIAKEANKSQEAVRLVAYTSSNSDEELTDYVMQIIERGSAFGSVVIERSPASPIRYKIDVQEGLYFGHGYERSRQLGLSVHADVGQNSPITIEDPKVLFFDGSLMNETQLKPILDKIYVDPKKPLRLIIAAYEVGNEICQICTGFNMRNPKIKIWCCGMRDGAEINYRFHAMQDAASFSGARVINFGDISEGNWSVDDLGSCEKVTITTDKTFLIGKSINDWIGKRAVQNINSLTYAKTPFDRECIQKRNAELTSGLVKLIVGGGHSSGIGERADRADDAIRASQACIKSGSLPGAGSSYIRAAAISGAGPELTAALKVIHATIMDNYGLDAKDNFKEGETLRIDDEGTTTGNFIDLGVADSFETISSVIRNGLELASLVATLGGLSLTTDLKNIELLSMTSQALRSK